MNRIAIKIIPMSNNPVNNIFLVLVCLISTLTPMVFVQVFVKYVVELEESIVNQPDEFLVILKSVSGE